MGPGGPSLCKKRFQSSCSMKAGAGFLLLFQRSRRTRAEMLATLATTPRLFLWFEKIFQHYMFNMESRHLLNLRVQNALDCISENFNLKNFPGGACARNSQKKSPFAVLIGSIAPILTLYTISQGPLYHKILRLPPCTVVHVLGMNHRLCEVHDFQAMSMLFCWCSWGPLWQGALGKERKRKILCNANDHLSFTKFIQMCIEKVWKSRHFEGAPSYSVHLITEEEGAPSKRLDFNTFSMHIWINCAKLKSTSYSLNSQQFPM